MRTKIKHLCVYMMGEEQEEGPQGTSVYSVSKKKTALSSPVRRHVRM